ncbi:TPM domain-containing protein [Agrococcus jejuensis]|uniref:TPM domain-containing protein n=1 Tax=Agrococcus jejuensis TaxID=399736 RepID=UPI0011A8D207|nr:TPM domain-containing protein [Agrococcus jejuensis]
MPTSIVRGIVAAGIAAAAGLGLSAGALVTEDPVDLGGDVFVDETGQFDVGEVTAALEAVNAESDVQVYAVVVSSFDGLAQGDWSNQAATASGLSADSVLLSIAIDDGQYGTSTGSGVDRSTDQIDDAATNYLEPALNDGDLEGGIAAFADRIAEDAATPGETAVQTGGAVVGGIAVVGVGAGVTALLVRRSRKKKAAKAEVEQHQLSLDQLKQRADIALVQLDDTVQQSEQELQFAEAQFGDEPVAQYAQAVERAKGGLREAFQLQQQLDDAFPDTDQERHDWSSRILQIAEGATAELGSQAKGFEQLRDLERTAPQALEAAAKARTELDARIANAKQILDRLDDRYTGHSIAPVQQNIAGAERLLPAIDEAVAQGRGAQGGQAAVAVHAAEAAIAQARSLLAGVERAGDDLAATEEQLRALVDDTVNDVAVARSLPRGATDLAPIIQLAEQAIADARRSPVDVAEVLPRLQRANDTLEQATGQSREESDRQGRAASSLQGWLTSARQNIDAAEQFLSTRRLAVGSHARQMLALAQEDLAQALRMQSSDVAAATDAARRASERAEQAMRDADDDVRGYGGGGMTGGFGSRNPYYRGRRGVRDGFDGDGIGGGMGNIGGAVMGGVLGSVLGNILMGGSHHGGGDWGASASGGDGGGFFGGGDGGGFSGGGGDFGGFFGGGGSFGGFDGGGGDF